MSEIQNCFFGTDMLLVIPVIEVAGKGRLKLHLLGG
jgi:hypothetical protein